MIGIRLTTYHQVKLNDVFIDLNKHCFMKMELYEILTFTEIISIQVVGEKNIHALN